MKIKKLIALIATGALAVSCVAVVAGCGSSYDPTEDLKEAFINTPRFSDPSNSDWTENEPFELVDFSYEEVATDPDTKEISDADITATVKNNITEILVQASATRTNPSSKSEDAEYKIEVNRIDLVNVIGGVNKVPSQFEDYAPDFETVTIDEQGDWRSSTINFTNLPSYVSKFAAICTLDLYSPVPVYRLQNDDYDIELNTAGIEGTYTTNDSDVVKSMTVKCLSTSEDKGSPQFNLELSFDYSSASEEKEYRTCVIDAGTFTGTYNLKVSTVDHAYLSMVKETPIPVSYRPNGSDRLSSDGDLGVKIDFNEDGSFTLQMHKDQLRYGDFIFVDDAVYTKS